MGFSGCFQLRLESRLILVTIQYRSVSCGTGGRYRGRYSSACTPCSSSSTAGTRGHRKEARRAAPSPAAASRVLTPCHIPYRYHRTATTVPQRNSPPPPAHRVKQDGGVAHAQARDEGVAQEAHGEACRGGRGVGGGGGRHAGVVKFHQRRQVAQDVVIHPHDAQQLVVACGEGRAREAGGGCVCGGGESLQSRGLGWGSGVCMCACAWRCVHCGASGHACTALPLHAGMRAVAGAPPPAGPSTRTRCCPPPPCLSCSRVTTPSIQYRLPKPASHALLVSSPGTSNPMMDLRTCRRPGRGGGRAEVRAGRQGGAVGVVCHARDAPEVAGRARAEGRQVRHGSGRASMWPAPRGARCFRQPRKRRRAGQHAALPAAAHGQPLPWVQRSLPREPAGAPPCPALTLESPRKAASNRARISWLYMLAGLPTPSLRCQASGSRRSALEAGRQAGRQAGSGRCEQLRHKSRQMAQGRRAGGQASGRRAGECAAHAAVVCHACGGCSGRTRRLIRVHGRSHPVHAAVNLGACRAQCHTQRQVGGSSEAAPSGDALRRRRRQWQRRVRSGWAVPDAQGWQGRGAHPTRPAACSAPPAKAAPSARTC